MKKKKKSAQMQMKCVSHFIAKPEYILPLVVCWSVFVYVSMHRLTQNQWASILYSLKDYRKVKEKLQYEIVLIAKKTKETK